MVENIDDPEPDQPLNGRENARVGINTSRTSLANTTSTFDIDMITGKKYQDDAWNRLVENKALRCPFPNVPSNFNVEGGQIGSGSKGCQYVFTRAYDLRRHLRTAHALVVEKEPVDDWVRRVKKDMVTAVDM